MAIQSKLCLKSEEVRCKAVCHLTPPRAVHRAAGFSPYMKWGPHRSGAWRMATITSAPHLATIIEDDVSEMQLSVNTWLFSRWHGVNVGLYMEDLD